MVSSTDLSAIRKKYGIRSDQYKEASKEYSKQLETENEAYFEKKKQERIDKEKEKNIKNKINEINEKERELFAKAFTEQQLNDASHYTSIWPDLLELFKLADVPEEVITEVYRGLNETSDKKYTFSLDSIRYLNGGVTLNVNFQNDSNQDDDIILSKDNNGAYRSVFKQTTNTNLREGIVSNQELIKTTRLNSNGLYEREKKKISKELALSGVYFSSVDPTLRIEILGVDILTKKKDDVEVLAEQLLELESLPVEKDVKPKTMGFTVPWILGLVTGIIVTAIVILGIVLIG